MQFSSFLLFAIFAVSISRCAPALDAATLADNARKAQALNTKFLTLNATDPCQGDETACVDGSIATCKDGKFDTSNGECQQGTQCFALPNIRAPGTLLECSSEKSVIASMKSCGVDGGITGSDPSDPNDGEAGDTGSSTTSSSTPCTPTSLPDSSPNDDTKPLTVTVTEFASSLSSTTTTTLSPSEASSILQKFLTTDQPPASSTSSPPLLTPVADPNNTPPASPSGSPILLLSALGDAKNPAPSPTPSPGTSTVTPIQLTARPEVPSPTPTPAPSPVAVGGGGGGGGYGGYGY